MRTPAADEDRSGHTGDTKSTFFCDADADAGEYVDDDVTISRVVHFVCTRGDDDVQNRTNIFEFMYVYKREIRKRGIEYIV